MKNLLLTIIVSLISISVGFSQYALQIEGGVNHGKVAVTQTDIYQHENITGGYLSLMPQYSLNNRMNLRSEFQFSIEGLGFENGYKHNLYYVRVIPGVELKVLGPLSVLGGLNIGYIATTGGCTGGSSFKIPKGTYKSSDLGLLTGINYTMNKFNLAVKYNFGLTSIIDINVTDVEGIVVDQGLGKNRFLQVGLGYRIDFKD
ncbi:outer membrane beta-barrel protein [Portibacter lacus]|uniref:Outer membrane protein beta-barrel domain-containing protein n=1 Tax=Portibacter lacus TaxID=1099794 RepID=A0AA37WBW2_9BACT|nr:outer membrane beta-barrel protein [Portibacter lacus]GLR15761.1 hypothetical protein GCM10007940_03760 [Portibacter lacus]